ncbi:MAG: NUDIX hydrolase [Lachnospiraceae bacterium]|nr:NUDIX hydrolase [Lachnospiraceae bacterium]
MKLLGIEKVRDGKYLKNYELTYLNKAGREKKYEIVSRSEISDTESLGSSVSGLSIVVICQDKLLLLREFRMGINRTIYNLCAGLLEPGESVEECIERELYEETGLKLKRIIDIMPPSFAAVAISDIQTRIAIVEAEGEFSDHTSDNEQIHAAFYTKEECAQLLKTAEFSSRSQMIAYFFTKNAFSGLDNWQ